MILSEVLMKCPNMIRLVVKGKDSRIKKIYNKEEIPTDILKNHVYTAYLRKDGDLDVQMDI